MCSLFGIYDYKGNLNERQLRKAVHVLAREAEIRGKDATGIAYNHNGKMTVFKRDLPAHKMRFHIPRGTRAVMGHTRLTTQGSEKYNENNHPFPSKHFALAHNGVLTNDQTLRIIHDLPKTKIETDSYVAVQLLEKAGALNCYTIASMAEKLQGSFTISILDRDDQLYLIKGDNPLEIYDFEKDGFCIYASTAEILNRSLKQLKLQERKYTRIHPVAGEILKLDHNGKWTKGEFDFHWFYDDLWRKNIPSKKRSEEDRYWEMLLYYGESLGYHRGDLLLLAEYGFEEEEIEEMLMSPRLMSDFLYGEEVF